MIPRYQTVLFFLLLAGSIIMGAILWQLLNHAHQRRLKGEQSTPTQAPLVAPAEQAILMVADDSDDSMSTRVLSLPLPPDPGARARALLGKLLDLYAAPDAAHPVPGGAASIAQVFLMPAPAGGSNPTASNESGAGIANGSEPGSRPSALSAATENESKSGPELAVVNLTGAFAASHPSGIETESLTVLSICATLHANLPRVAEVRFLVDGRQHETLAGHADLTRTYLTTEAAAAVGAQP